MSGQQSVIERNKRYVQKFLEQDAKECEVCGWRDIKVLDFYPSIRQFIVHSYARSRIDDEMSKRTVLCANCRSRKEAGLDVYTNSIVLYGKGMEKHANHGQSIPSGNEEMGDLAPNSSHSIQRGYSPDWIEYPNTPDT